MISLPRYLFKTTRLSLIKMAIKIIKSHSALYCFTLYLIFQTSFPHAANNCVKCIKIYIIHF